MLTQMNGAYVRSNIELHESYASLSLRKSFKMRIMIFWPKLNLSIEQEMCFKTIAWFETCGYLDIPIPFFVWNNGLVVKVLDSQSSPGVFSSKWNEQKMVITDSEKLKGCVGYIFASLFYKSKREHKNKDICFSFHFESSFRSWDNQILYFQIFRYHDVIKCLEKPTWNTFY